jgi:hypothetical protein
MESEPPGGVNTGEILGPQVYLYLYSDFLNPERTWRDADFLEDNGLEYAALYGETGAPYSMRGIRMAVVGRKPT